MRLTRRRTPGPRIAVIGGGFGGIATAVKLTRAGFDNFTVFEKSDGPGGVWWDNTYPGAAVDTPTHTYSFSFKRFDWSKSHADQAELQRYMEETIDEFDVRSHFRFRTPVDQIRWDDESSTWLVSVDGEDEVFDFVISAVGLLNVPRYPDWPGLESFKNPKFHTSRWESEHDLAGKRVAVVGTGSSAVQIVSRVAEVAEKLTVFQREPGWVNPKPVTVYDDAQRRALTRPWRYRLERIRGYRETSKSRHGGDIHVDGSPANTAARERCERYIAEVFADRPDLQKLVTPDYPYFGKRPIKDSNYYPALKRDNVELVPRAVIEVTETGVIDADGVEHDIDVLIMSTGFQPSRYLAQLPVAGRGGVSLQETWGDEPSAFLGITVPGFPNFFMLYGPNTNSPTVLFQLERQAEFAISAIRWLLRRRAREIEVLPWAHDVYNIWLQWQMRDSVWATSNNYFKSPTGRVVTQWPVSPTLYWLFTKTLLRPSSRLT